MKHFLVILFFFIISLFKPVFISAAPINDPGATTPTDISAPIPIETSPSNTWAQFWNWLFGLFVKTDYTISTRPLSDINSDMTDYGDKNQPGALKDKRSFAGSRSTNYQSQICFKGNVIKKVVLNTAGYPNSDLSYVCTNSNQCSVSTDSTCKLITTKDLAHYFVQLQKQFYCASDKDELIDIEQTIIDKVNQFSSSDIPENEINCYQQIYDDFYLTPKDTTDNEEENTKKMIKTPIPQGSQDENSSSIDLQKQLDKNFSPDGSSAGLQGLRPANW